MTRPNDALHQTRRGCQTGEFTALRWGMLKNNFPSSRPDVLYE